MKSYFSMLKFFTITIFNISLLFSIPILANTDNETVKNDVSLFPEEINTQKAKDPRFEGYQIKFDYEKYPEEREIGYQYYLDEESKYLPGIDKKNIGIDLYDIDDDGKKEIFVYVDGDYRCPRAGCPYAILRKNKVDQDVRPYKKVLLSPRAATSHSIYKDDAPKILNSTTLGYHDIMYGREGEQVSIKSWKGEYYDTSEVIDY